MLPGVDDEQVLSALPDVALMVVDLLDVEALAERLPRERSPSGALNRHDGLGHLGLERVERAKVLVDRGGEVAGRLVASRGAEVLPEERVEHVTREVEREGLLEADDVVVVALLAGVGESLERLVAPFHVRLVVLAVMKGENLGGVEGLEGVLGVRKIREGVRHAATVPVGRVGRNPERCSSGRRRCRGGGAVVVGSGVAAGTMIST